MMMTTKETLPILMNEVPITWLYPITITLRLHGRILERGKLNAEERNNNYPVRRMGRLLMREPSSLQQGVISVLQ